MIKVDPSPILFYFIFFFDPSWSESIRVDPTRTGVRVDPVRLVPACFKVPEVAHFQEPFYPFDWWPEYFRISSSFSLLILAKRSELNFFTPLIPL